MSNHEVRSPARQREIDATRARTARAHRIAAHERAMDALMALMIVLAIVSVTLLVVG